MNKWIQIKDYRINLSQVKIILEGETTILFDFGAKAKEDYLGFSCHKDNKNYIQITPDELSSIKESIICKTIRN